MPEDIRIDDFGPAGWRPGLDAGPTARTARFDGPRHDPEHA